MTDEIVWSLKTEADLPHPKSAVTSLEAQLVVRAKNDLFLAALLRERGILLDPSEPATVSIATAADTDPGADAPMTGFVEPQVHMFESEDITVAFEANVTAYTTPDCILPRALTQNLLPQGDGVATIDDERRAVVRSDSPSALPHASGTPSHSDQPSALVSDRRDPACLSGPPPDRVRDKDMQTMVEDAKQDETPLAAEGPASSEGSTPETEPPTFHGSI